MQVKNTLIQLERQNNTIVLVYPIPEQGWNVPNLFKNGNFEFGDSVGYDTLLFENRASLSYEIYDSELLRILSEYIQNICFAIRM